MNRTEELVVLVRKHRQLYYNGTPEVEDDVFDAWVDELTELDPNSDVLQEVGAPVDDEHWEVVEHTIPMTSLDKVNTEEEMSEWLAQRAASQYCVQEKLDGISISIEYRDGKLYRAVTRGAGLKGEDITRNVRKMKGVPATVDIITPFTLRGEIMMLQEDFEEYNRACVQNGWRNEPYKNARNGASGTARRLDGKGCEFLTVFMYEYYDGFHSDDVSEEQTISWLEEIGFTVPFYDLVTSFEDLAIVYNEYEAVTREVLPYEIDGLVIKVDLEGEAQAIENRLQTSTRKGKNPKHAVAWKFSAETRVTVLEDIIWNLGKGGRVTPIAMLKPVGVGGVTVRRASLHNWDNVKDLNLAKGATVLIKRANDVIPQVVKRVDREDLPLRFHPPAKCPSCTQDLQWDNKYLECVNPACEALLMGTLRRWVEKVEVKFFGESVIEALVRDGKVKSISELYKLSLNDIERSTSPGIAKRAHRNLHANKELDLNVVIGSLGIKSFGRSLARMMVEAGYDTVDKMLAATRSEIAAIEQFGEERADIIVNGLKRNEPVIRELEQLLTVVTPAGAPQVVGALTGLSFCITGKLSKPKKYYAQLITGAGGEYKTSVRKGLDYLVAADPDSGSSKIKKAEKAGVRIISEARLLGMVST